MCAHACVCPPQPSAVIFRKLPDFFSLSVFPLIFYFHSYKRSNELSVGGSAPSLKKKKKTQTHFSLIVRALTTSPFTKCSVFKILIANRHRKKFALTNQTFTCPLKNSHFLLSYQAAPIRRKGSRRDIWNTSIAAKQPFVLMRASLFFSFPLRIWVAPCETLDPPHVVLLSCTVPAGKSCFFHIFYFTLSFKLRLNSRTDKPSCYVISFYVTWCYVMSCHVMLRVSITAEPSWDDTDRDYCGVNWGGSKWRLYTFTLKTTARF